MGVAISRDFSDAVADCVNRGGSLENLLEDPEVFVHRWKTSYQALPPRAQKSLEDLTRHQSQEKRGKTCLSKVQQVQATDICIPESLKPIFDSWKQPATFFNRFARLKGASTVSQVYEELRHINQRKADDPIRSRIYAVALYDLRVKVDGDTSLQLRPEVKEKIVQVISDSPIISDSPKSVAKWTEFYLKFGERMKAIADENGGLGALIVMPSPLLSLNQWVKELNANDLKGCIRHLQSIEVDEKARKAGAHAVAKRIHSTILKRFSSSIEDPNTNHKELMLDEEADEDLSSEDVVEDNGSSNVSNAASSCTSLSTLAHGVHRGREHFCEAGIEAEDLMVIDEQWPPRRLTPAFDGVRSNATSSVTPMDLLSRAADVASHQNGQRNEGYDSVQPLQSTPSEPFPTTAKGTEQLPGFGADLNNTVTNTVPNVFNDAWAHSQPLDPKFFNDAWAHSQSLDPRFYNDVWSLSQPLDPRLYNDVWSLSRSLEPDPGSF